MAKKKSYSEMDKLWGGFPFLIEKGKRKLIL